MASADAPLRQAESLAPDRGSMIAPKTRPLDVAQLLYAHVSESELGEDDPARAKRIFAAMRRLRGCE